MLKLLTRLDRSFALGIACRGERHVWKVAKGSLPGPPYGVLDSRAEEKRRNDRFWLRIRCC